MEVEEWSRSLEFDGMVDARWMSMAIYRYGIHESSGSEKEVSYSPTSGWNCYLTKQ